MCLKNIYIYIPVLSDTVKNESHGVQFLGSLTDLSSVMNLQGIII